MLTSQGGRRERVRVLQLTWGGRVGGWVVEHHLLPPPLPRQVGLPSGSQMNGLNEDGDRTCMPKCVAAGPSCTATRASAAGLDASPTADRNHRRHRRHRRHRPPAATLRPRFLAATAPPPGRRPRRRKGEAPAPPAAGERPLAQHLPGNRQQSHDNVGVGAVLARRTPARYTNPGTGHSTSALAREGAHGEW